MTDEHYKRKVQPIELIEAFDLNFNRGNIIKYVSRAGNKTGCTEVDDLNKALNYLQRELERLES